MIFLDPIPGDSSGLQAFSFGTVRLIEQVDRRKRMSNRGYRSVPLPAAWPKHARAAVLHAISLAAAALTATRGWAAGQLSPRVRLRAANERLEQEIAHLRE